MATPAPVATTDAFACAQCSAPQTFDPATSKLICDHCGAAVAIVLADEAIVSHDLFGKEAIASLRASELAAGASSVTCTQCGAQAIVTRRADRCTFCDAPMVFEVDTAISSIPPGGVVPFVVDGKQAAVKFQNWLAKRWFAPSDLVRHSKRDRLDGVYLPFWFFDAAATTQYDGQRGTVRTTTETYTDSDGKSQTRQVETVDWYPASGTVSTKSTNVMVSASAALSEKLVAKLSSWDLVRTRAFDPRFLAGFVAETYKVQPSDGFTTAYPIIESQIKSAICRDIGGDRQQVGSMNVDWNAVAFRHVLLPLWLASFRYGGKIFHVAVNAETGEVEGERPWSWQKIVLLVAVIFAAVAATVFAIKR
jgi:hypothetical protein